MKLIIKFELKLHENMYMYFKYILTKKKNDNIRFATWE